MILAVNTLFTHCVLSMDSSWNLTNGMVYVCDIGALCQCLRDAIYTCKSIGIAEILLGPSRNEFVNALRMGVIIGRPITVQDIERADIFS